MCECVYSREGNNFMFPEFQEKTFKEETHSLASDIKLACY